MDKKISSEKLREQIQNGLEKQKSVRQNTTEIENKKIEDKPIEIETTLQDNPYESMSVKDIASDFLSEEELKFIEEDENENSLDIINETADFVYDEDEADGRKYADEPGDDQVTYMPEADEEEVIPEYETPDLEQSGEQFVDTDPDESEENEKKTGIFSRLRKLLIVEKKDDGESENITEEDLVVPVDYSDENTIDNEETNEEVSTDEQLEISDVQEESIEEAEPEDKETENADEGVDNTDVKLMMAFGMEEQLENSASQETIEEVKSEIDSVGESNSKISESIKTVGKKILVGGKKIVDNKSKDKEENEEYTSVSQINKIFFKYKKKYNILLIKLVIGIVLLVLSFFFENITLLGGHLPEGMDMAYFPIVHSMLSLQLTVFAFLLVPKSLWRGIQSIINKKIIPETITFVLALFTVFYDIVICFADNESALSTYGFVAIFGVFITLVYDFMNVKREIYCFNVVSSKKDKLTIVPLEEEQIEMEKEAFGEMVNEEAEFFRIERTKFIDGFFENLGYNDRERKPVGLLLLASFISSIAFFIIGWITLGNFLSGCNMGMIALLFALPVSSFISYGYPLYRAGESAYSVNSAIIGETSIEKYSKANVISFDDSEIFPPYNIRVRHITTYGENRIDEIICNAAGIFSKVGGPMKIVFENVSRDLGMQQNIDIISIEEMGIESLVEGQHTFVGKKEYLKKMGVDCSIISNEENDVNNEICVLYMAVSTEVVAKIQIQYIMDQDFAPLLKHLYKAGICVGIKTCDPNINDVMLSRTVEIGKYPVKILRVNTSMESVTVSDRVNSGIVSKGSAKELLQTLSLCEKASESVKNCKIVKIFAAVLSIIASIIVVIFGSGGALNSFWIVLYQLFWMLPIIIITKITVEKFGKR